MHNQSQKQSNFKRICYKHVMEIQCPNCNKIFKIDKKFITENGRLLQCGSCKYKWFFKPDIKKIEKLISKLDYESDTNDNFDEKGSKFEEINVQEENKIVSQNNKIDLQKEVKTEIINKDDKIINIKKINFVKLLIVILISFVALILVLDTFKDAFTSLFPNINFLLNNLYETLKDLFLFLNDLVR